MPIGFWAISRTEVRKLYQQCGSGQAPSTEALDRLVRKLGDALEETLSEIIFQATRKERKELP